MAQEKLTGCKLPWKLSSWSKFSQEIETWPWLNSNRNGLNASLWRLSVCLTFSWSLTVYEFILLFAIPQNQALGLICDRCLLCVSWMESNSCLVDIRIGFGCKEQKSPNWCLKQLMMVSLLGKRSSEVGSPGKTWHVHGDQSGSPFPLCCLSWAALPHQGRKKCAAHSVVFFSLTYSLWNVACRQKNVKYIYATQHMIINRTHM